MNESAEDLLQSQAPGARRSEILGVVLQTRRRMLRTGEMLRTGKAPVEHQALPAPCLRHSSYQTLGFGPEPLALPAALQLCTWKQQPAASDGDRWRVSAALCPGTAWDSLGQQAVLSRQDSFPRARLAWAKRASSALLSCCGSLLLPLLQGHWPENELPSIGQGQVRSAVA